MLCEVGSWLLIKKEFKGVTMNDLTRDYITCISIHASRVHPSREWVPPCTRNLKINFDGASFGNPSPAGYGCVLRDHDGVIEGVNGGPIRRADANQAKLIGLLESLRLLKSRNITECMVEGDSKTVISRGNGEMVRSWRLRHLIYKIQALIEECKATLHHVPRDRNSMDNNIATWSVDQLNSFEGECMPDSLM